MSSTPALLTPMDIETLSDECHRFLVQHMDGDPAHDLSHVMRVVENTKRLTRIEKGDINITLPAAWLHDCVAVAKDSPLRQQASKLAADKAVEFLAERQYPATWLPQVHHAIEAHSFSANIATETLEAAIVQDADRLEALGAIGITRCFLTGGSLGTALYDPADPFATKRKADDRRYTLDHFYCKLLGLADTMKTQAGKDEALRRTDYMQDFLHQLGEEIGV